MAKAGQMIAYEVAQDEILSSTPTFFTFSNPPSIGWWKAKLDLGLAAVVFVDYYLSVLGKKLTMRGPVFGEADVAAQWQAASGITPKQWEGAKAELSVNGTGLLSFSIFMMKNRRRTWIRPSDQLLAVFGTTLKAYDIVAALDRRMSRQLGGSQGPGGNTVSQEEFEALALWASIGGLARLPNADRLGQQLKTHHAIQSAASA
jgi:hypothetical protein